MEQLIASHPYIALFIAGQLGMAGHWLKRWYKDETAMGLFAFFKKNRRPACGSMLILASVIIGMVATGEVTGDMKTMAVAFLAGFNLNSMFTPQDASEK